METAVVVQKETLKFSSFAKHEVLKNQQDIDLRRFYLMKAQALGNLYRQKVTITYQLMFGEVQKVQTTVWAVSEHYVTLKGGITIPIHAIMEVEF
jgi:hypothetical protein